MGWERKRGKLLDLNKLLKGQFDPFPVKAGNLSALTHAQYVITLDSDTQLPRGTAHTMIGAMAHPLNRAIIDPELRIVTEGYGILQPRVGVSVQSASRSRLASIYSGQTGFDIYTRAISDAYQDLYGEGIFTGKGIYEINALHAVLDRRFPRNSLLSHDLIEGSYARVGLTTDIEVIDDYPSHYSAYTRRKHRWVRGDWQIAQWLFAKVPDESGRYVRNPIATISRWKIFDNLRRSLVEVFTFALLLAGWLGLARRRALLDGGHPVPDVRAHAGPVCLQPGPRLFHQAAGLHARRRQRLLAGHVYQPAQPGLPAPPDAAGPGRHHPLAGAQLYHRPASCWSGKPLPRPKSTAQPPHAGRPLPCCDSPGRPGRRGAGLPAPSGVAAGRAAHSYPVGLCRGHHRLAQSIRPSRPSRSSQRKKILFLRQLALRTWRYFNQFGGESHNYLIPDNVEEEGLFEAARVSPTNFGLLLNARQAANTFGYLTIPEFIILTERSLQTYDKLEKFRGHIYNWYDTRTLAPIRPHTISSVDSGNLAASFYTLRTGCRSLLREPLLDPGLFAGIRDHWQLLMCLPDAPAGLKALAPPAAGRGRRCDGSPGRWPLSTRLFLSRAATAGRRRGILVARRNPSPHPRPGHPGSRLHAVAAAPVRAAARPAPVARPCETPGRSVSTGSRQCPGRRSRCPHRPGLDQPGSRFTPGAAGGRAAPRAHAGAGTPEGARRANCRTLASEAMRFATEMDFGFLMDRSRLLLSIGYEIERQHLHQACYDLL